VKIDDNGNLQWSKCYGGSKNEELVDFEEINGTLYAAGYANSIDGDIPPSQKNYDIWLLALDEKGDKIFSKVYGGSQNDVAYSMCKGIDGSLTLAGYTTSNDGAVSGAKGDQDYWIINLSTQGKLNWQKVLGGSQADFANIVITDKDGGYITGGISYSKDGDITDNKGKGDYFVIKLSSAGQLLWTKNYGGAATDNMRGLAFNEARNEVYLAGDSESGEVDTVRNNHGGTDYWIIKLKQPRTFVKDTFVCDVATFQQRTDTLKDNCGYDSLFQTYRPQPLKGPFDKLRTIDTIFLGQRITLAANTKGSIRWNPDATLSCTDCRNPVASPLQTTTYTAIQYLDTGACEQTGNFKVVVLNDAVVYIPSAFSPNNDGNNDVFGPMGKVPEGYKMEIYNRFGQLVFKSTSINTRWDGALNGRPQDSGIYIYVVQYKDVKNNQQLRKGSFLLVR
jgi:gliding motility-associated-like protein